MVFVYLMEWAVAALILLFVVTQILFPMWSGTAYFPFFKKRYRELDAELADLETRKVERRMEERIERERQSLEEQPKEEKGEEVVP